MLNSADHYCYSHSQNQDEFLRLGKVSWYVDSFSISNGGFWSSWGKAHKYFLLKPTFLSSIAVFELGSLIYGAAPSSTSPIIGRVIQGLGAAGKGTGTYTSLLLWLNRPSVPL